MSNYSLADVRTQWFQDNYPGSDLTLNENTMVAVIHTTETYTWPGYSDGATAPNYTGQPPVGRLKGQWRGHFPDEKSSRALKNNSGGVETNTLNSVQFELIGTCDPKHSQSWNGEGKVFAGQDYVFWPMANETQLAWLAAILVDMHKRHGLRLVAPKEFKAYPASYGDNGVRLSFDAWRSASGVFGHQHIPENVHGDPGNIRMGRVLDVANSTLKPIFVKPEPTRGAAVDKALAALRSAKGSGKRGKLIAAAKKTLRKIPILKK